MREQLKLNRTKCVFIFLCLGMCQEYNNPTENVSFDKWTPFTTTLGFVIALTEMSYNLTNI